MFSFEFDPFSKLLITLKLSIMPSSSLTIIDVSSAYPKFFVCLDGSRGGHILFDSLMARYNGSWNNTY